MTNAEVAAWLTEYVAAWKSYDPAAIGKLFSEDAVYRFHPWDEPVRGRTAIVANWLENRDEPGTYDGAYAPFVVDGQRAVAIGQTRYFAPDGTTLVNTFHNAYMLEFNQAGECSQFTEWFMKLPTNS